MSYYRNIAVKVVGKHEFVLQLQEITDMNGKVEGYDYIISGPNWLSGFLKAQGMSEKEVFEYWDEVTIEDANDAWEEHYERGRC